MSLGSTRNPPPLSLPLSAHPLYPEIVLIGQQGGKILDLGCGPGKDLLQLVKDGVPASNLCGMDKESGFQTLLSTSLRLEGISDPLSFISGDLTSLLPSPETNVEPSLARWFETQRGTFSVVVCNRLLHLLPPRQHAPLLSLVLSQLLLPTSSSPLLLVGLQRALPPSSTAISKSGYHPISSNPTSSETETHWLWESTEWDALLESVCALERKRSGSRVNWGSEFLDGAELG
ncbi:hypothetical protein BDY24DRAFT_440610, partial [Mrakia frigida]|uniref:class I SAM-dependent methyltransferase n=1 Tax=Mrakia frigida TaxID=29902 RepID=UPI003FCC0D1D